MMDFDMGDDIDALRTQLRTLIADELPADYLGAFTDDPNDLAIAQAFCRLLAEQGLLCMAWPEEFGGQDASPWAQTAVREEMWAFHEPRGAQYMGVNWVGPTILAHGTDEQKAQHLPPIAEGEVIWCQGFSEPDAGSDLASLKTTAVREVRPSGGEREVRPSGGEREVRPSGGEREVRPSGGEREVSDTWVINGQKIWTSYATMAQWCFLLVRTSKQARKQDGLTIFLLPMERDGIEVRPIATMMGPHHLNEVFFDDVRATDDDILGELDGGWQVVQEVLSFERVGIARYARCERLLQEAPAALGEQWDELPPELHGRWMDSLVDCRRARLLAYRVIERQGENRVAPGDTAAYRIAVTTNDQTTADVLHDIVALSDPGGPGAGPGAQRWARAVEDHIRYAVSATVASGSTEIQRILLARAILGEARAAAGGDTR